MPCLLCPTAKHGETLADKMVDECGSGGGSSSSGSGSGGSGSGGSGSGVSSEWS